MEREEGIRRITRLKILAEVVGKDMSPEAAAAFVKTTETIPPDRFDAGIDKATAECRFMPSPAEFRELAWVMPSAAEANAAWAKRWGVKPV